MHLNKVMSKFYKKIIHLIIFTSVLFLLLFVPTKTLAFAQNGLAIWYQSMLPALLPMMIVTSCMIKLNVTTLFSSFLYPFTKRLYHISQNGTYALLIGFLCGFPMGAKVICELYQYKRLSKEEANLLLPICNNIGPIFLITYGLKPLVNNHLYFILLLFYAIPLVYAYFLFKKKHFTHKPITPSKSPAFSIALDEAISEGAMSILSLGGYLMFFSILTLIPMSLLKIPDTFSVFLTCLLEITNGLSYKVALPPYIYLSLIQFGGICCIFQTLKYISKTDLSFKKYLLHKIILTLITLMVFYFVDVFSYGVFFAV